MLLSVVEKLGFETNLATDVLEELGNCFNVEILIENAARRYPNRPFPFTGLDESSPPYPPSWMRMCVKPRSIEARTPSTTPSKDVDSRA